MPIYRAFFFDGHHHTIDCREFNAGNHDLALRRGAAMDRWFADRGVARRRVDRGTAAGAAWQSMLTVTAFGHRCAVPILATGHQPVLTLGKRQQRCLHSQKPVSVLERPGFLGVRFAACRPPP